MQKVEQVTQQEKEQMYMQPSTSSTPISARQEVSQDMLILRSEIGLKPVQELTRAITSTQVRKIDELRSTRATLEQQLQQKRSNYQWWDALFASKEAQHELLESVKKAGEQLKSEIAKMPAFHTLKQDTEQRGRKPVLLEVAKLVIWADAQINTGVKLSTDQVTTISEAIISEYGGLCIEHVAECIKRAILHGAVVMRLDTQVVMSWLRKYVEEREAQTELLNYNRHLASK